MRPAIFVLFLSPAILPSQQSTGEIRGSVVGAGADMLHAAHIELRNGEARRLGQTSSSGDFRFPDLAPGVYDLTISMSFERPTTIRSVRVEPGKVRLLSPLQPAFDGIFDTCRRSPSFFTPLDSFETTKGSVGGRIIDDHAVPLAEAKVRTYIPNVGFLGSAITDPTGRFSIPDIPAGARYEIAVARDGFFSEDFSEFEVQAGYESFYDSIDLFPCEKDRCTTALRPFRPRRACA